MLQVLLVIHLLIALALVGVVLIQRSEGGGLGIGGGGGAGGMMQVRGTGNMLTRVTAVLAAAFMGMSLLLAVLSTGASEPTGIVTDVPTAVDSTAGDDGGVPADGASDGAGGDGLPSVPLN